MPPLKARIPPVTLVLQESSKELRFRPDRRIRTCNFDVSESRRKLAALKRTLFRDCFDFALILSEIFHKLYGIEDKRYLYDEI